MKRKCLFVAAASVVFAVAGGAAGAGTVFDNLNITSGIGDCSFSTACAAASQRGDEFAAQQFTLGTATTINSAAFSELDLNTTPTSVNYAFYADVGGLPSGAALFSGSSLLTATSVGFADDFNVSLASFSVTSAALGAGSYFFAIQAVSPVFATFLQQGTVESGAAETHDGGVTWTAGYETGQGGTSLGGISVALYNAVPEPATWAIMLMGVGMIGGGVRMARRKNAAVLSAA